MLSAKALTVLRALTYRPDADWAVNILPFGSIYWNDEMPDVRSLLDFNDMALIFKMFGIRLNIWDGKPLTNADQQLWNTVQRQVPHWALFKRLSLSDEQRLARAEAERQVEQEFESLGADDW